VASCFPVKYSDVLRTAAAAKIRNYITDFQLLPGDDAEVSIHVTVFAGRAAKIYDSRRGMCGEGRVARTACELSGTRGTANEI